MAPQELENSASKYASDAINADSQGAYGMAKLLLGLVFDLNNDILSKIFIIVFSGLVFGIASTIIGFPLLAALGYIKYANNRFFITHFPTQNFLNILLIISLV